MTVSVYRVTRRETGDSYIGISKDPQARWRQHKWAAKNRPHGYFPKALAKYGPESFDWKVVAKLPTLQEAQIAERILIACENPEYNLSAGGDGNWGYVPTAETREKIGAAHRGMKRPPRSPEHVDKLRAAQLGKKHSDQTKAKIGAFGVGRKQCEETIAKRVAKTKGQVRGPHSAEHAAKISANWYSPARLASLAKRKAGV